MFAIVPKMTVNVTGDVLLAASYALGYGVCDSRSLMQWLCRASAVLVSCVLYVFLLFGDEAPVVLAPAMVVVAVTDLCDNHRDAVSLLQRTVGTALLGCMNAAEFPSAGNWVATFVSAGMALLLDASSLPLPSADAVAVIMAAVAPARPEPWQSLVRLVLLCGIMFAHRDASHALNAYNLAHAVVAPLPAACAIALAQVMLVARKRRGVDAVETVMV